MASRRTFSVLAKLQPSVRQITIFNSDNFATNDRRILRRHIFQAAPMCILYTMLLVVFSFDYWLCFYNEHDWSQRAYHFAIAISLLQQFIVYVWKNRRVTGVLEQLQASVEKRKLRELC